MRKLRTYKGVTYNPEAQMWVTPHGRRSSASSAIESFPKLNLTDDDHAELMRLKAEPYEPVPRLEDVVYGWLKEEIGCRTGGTFPPINHWRLIDRLRAAFPHIDQEER
jgi:hypothetical protein